MRMSSPCFSSAGRITHSRRENGTGQQQSAHPSSQGTAGILMLIFSTSFVVAKINMVAGERIELSQPGLWARTAHLGFPHQRAGPRLKPTIRQFSRRQPLPAEPELFGRRHLAGRAPVKSLLTIPERQGRRAGGPPPFHHPPEILRELEANESAPGTRGEGAAGFSFWAFCQFRRPSAACQVFGWTSTNRRPAASKNPCQIP